MHNSHFIIGTGTDIKDVESSIRRKLDSWGTENNWSDIVRTVDLSEATEEDIEYIKEILNEFNDAFTSENIKKVENRIEEWKELAKEKPFYYGVISEEYKLLAELKQHEGKQYTVEDIKSMPDFFGYTFDEWGITYIDFDDSENAKVFFTEIDMHS